jgi:hypothetical protein
MNQDYYHYIHQIHQRQIEIDRINASLSGKTHARQSLRNRLQLTMSDALLGLGQRIRPAEFQVQVSQQQEGTLEIEAGGC